MNILENYEIYKGYKNHLIIFLMRIHIMFKTSYMIKLKDGVKKGRSIVITSSWLGTYNSKAYKQELARMQHFVHSCSL